MSADTQKHAVISAEDRNRAAIALAEAMGRAREQHTVRDTMRTDARVNAQQRLEMLRLKLTPVFEAIPRDAEQFNLGVVTAEKPRLYIDIIGYVEMTSHLKGYRLMQETRRGVQNLAESNDEAGIIAMVTDYIARRLVDRERALAGASPATPLKAVAVSEPAVVAPVAPVMAPVMAAVPAAITSHATSDMVASAREGLQAAALVVEEPARASPIMHAAAQAAEQVKERATSLMESAKQAMTPKATTPKAMTPQATTPQATTPQAMTPQITPQAVAPQPVAVEVAPDEPVPSSWRKTTTTLATPAVAASAVAATGAALSTRSGGGGWVWALLSLFIGIGIGALLLYFYALSLARP
jgi:hypothetical protein